MGRLTARLTGVEVETVQGTAVNIAVDGRPFIIANKGEQPLYINPTTTATTANGFLIPANTVLDLKMTCFGNLSAISNATGTTVSIMYFDL